MSKGNDSPQSEDTAAKSVKACAVKEKPMQRENAHWDYSHHSETISSAHSKGNWNLMFHVWHQPCRLLIISCLCARNLLGQQRAASEAWRMWGIMWLKISGLRWLTLSLKEGWHPNIVLPPESETKLCENWRHPLSKSGELSVTKSTSDPSVWKMILYMNNITVQAEHCSHECILSDTDDNTTISAEKQE